MSWLDPGSGRLLGYFLRLVAVLYGLSSLVHAGNLVGLGQISPAEAPLLWTALDVVYLGLDVAVAIGLWRRTRWGIACFFAASASQLVLYTAFSSHFAQTAQQADAIRGLVLTHVVALSAYATLRLVDR